ncbi:TIP41-like protein [Phragmites australis]|uniref:TIP41-like protein n=1 Tax=Phragmites australis TaxID=29695 RepID=UPI002D79EC19|nr:TIP41-like protein [Phragmites australis]
MATAAAWEGPTAAELKAAGAEAIPGGVRVKGWVIQSHKGPILNAASLQLFEYELQTTHLPEMVFGESFLSLQHIQTGIKLHFNALDALKAWKKEALPPVEVPAAAKWKFRSKPSDQVILDYDYTFTTPYSGSDDVVLKPGTMQASLDGCSTLHWEDTDDRIDLVALSAKEPILFYDEVILYEDELADNGISFLTVRVRVMPTGWFLLLRFWLRVDGVLMRLRDTRIYCSFGNSDEAKPVVLRECCWREATFASLTAKGYPSDSAAYADPNLVAQKLPIVMQKTQKLKIPN